ncbi:MAG: amidohydrolase family protein [Bacteroidetes bacterium]|nr:amidohydrolase family protein [Bacteroidota bacterium]
MMRKLTADFILNPNGQLLNKHTLVIEDDGKILDLVPSVFDEAEEFKGILSPGFINTHCHLELSHFKNKIHQHTGLDGFINEFVQTRKNAELSDLTSNEEANEYMWKSGIQAVGDICNNASTFVLKNKSAIRYHSFIEIFSMSASDAAITFREGLHLLNQGKASHTNASLVPHAPYSCTTNLFEFIQNFHNATNSKWCIHNQESSSENEMFLNASGKLLKMFSKKGIDMSWLIPSGTTSLQTISKHFPLTSNILLVHNTYTSLTDIQFLKN